MDNSKHDIIAKTSETLTKLDSICDTLLLYQKLYVTACMILDSHLPLDGGESWEDMILDVTLEANKKSYS